MNSSPAAACSPRSAPSPPSARRAPQRASKFARYYDGPVSDHFDGTRFIDPNGSAPKTFVDLMRWRFAGGGAKWPERAPSPYSDKPPGARRRCVPAHRLSSGTRACSSRPRGLNILTDPVWSERASPFTFVGPKRVNDPGIPFDALPKIDAVLVTHNHYDHLDVDYAVAARRGA